MPIENDVKENDIEPPKPAMTYDQYTRLVLRRQQSQRDEYLQMFSELREQMRKNYEEAQKYREETQSRFVALESQLDAIIKDNESYKAKYTKQPEPEPVVEIRELKEQVIELQAENKDLKNTICHLWELLTSFFRTKITSVTKDFNSFFYKSKNSSSPDTSIEVENNSSTNSF